VAIAAATAAVLALMIPGQLFDTNFYTLWEATNLLAGDHPYRDFFEWGVPLQALISAAAQWIVGHRMIGEFILVHWPFIVAGAVISFDLGYRLTRSLTATAVAAAIALAVLPDTPTFHYPKLFFYPLAIWLSWRYLDRPGAGAAAALGLATAVAFLFRHDHGLYVGVAAVLACVLARWTAPGRAWRLTLRETGAYAASATAVLLPWLLLVHVSEGVPEYVRARADLYEKWAGAGTFREVLAGSPARLFDGWVPRSPQPGILRFSWRDVVSDRERTGFEQRLGLRRIEGPAGDSRWAYHVDDLNRADLHELRNSVAEAEGFDWTRLEARNRWLPAREPARLWMAQITALVPFLLVASAAFAVWRHARNRTHAPPETPHLLLAGLVLIVIDAKLFREPSYAHLVAPLTAAMGARFLTVPPMMSGLQWARLTVAVALTGMTAVAAMTCMQPLRAVFSNLHSVPESFSRMLVSPPIEAYATRADVDRWTAAHDRAAWDAGQVQRWPEIVLRYMHDCTAPGDRLFVTGSTPFHTSYLVERPIAGGHLFWHHRWRADPDRESRLLTLLQSQSVPFAFSTHDPILDDLRPYPRIRAYLETHYRELPGTGRRLLVDQRRRPTGTFGPYAFACFK
jgi:hypothetical protein